MQQPSADAPLLDLADTVRVHRPALIALARRLCRPPLDPADLVQDTLERLVARRPAHPDGVAARAWLFRVLRNRFIDLTRGPRYPRALDPAELPAPEPEPEPWWRTMSPAAVDAALAALPPALRAPLALHALDGLDYQAIADRLGVCRNTVGSRICRARRRLRAQIAADADAA